MFRARLLAVAVAMAAPLILAPSSMAAGCGFLGLGACPQPPVTNPAARTPGQPVPQVTQVNRAIYGTPNKLRGTVKPTKVLGVPDPGTVPVVGDVGAKADDGSYVMYETRVDERTIDLMVWSAGLLGPAPVRIQLPPSWGTDSARKYPGLFLLHGGGDPADYQCWTVYSQFTKRIGDLEALVVMPSSGVGGHTTNYLTFGYKAGKQYQTFVTTELWQILQRGYKLGDKASVAGASAGARSALEVAFKNRDKFVGAAAYSGLLHTQMPVIQSSIALGPTAAMQTPYEMWGDSIINNATWTDRNPTAQLDKLKDLPIYVSAGDGSQGPLDVNFIVDPLEAVVNASTKAFVEAAKKANLNMTADMYGKGVHQWQYFDRSFGNSLPTLLAPLGLTPQPQPAPIVTG